MQAIGRTDYEAAFELAGRLELQVDGDGCGYFFASPPLDPDWGEVRIKVEQSATGQFVASTVGEAAQAWIDHLEGMRE